MTELTIIRPTTDPDTSEDHPMAVVDHTACPCGNQRPVAGCQVRITTV